MGQQYPHRTQRLTNRQTRDRNNLLLWKLLSVRYHRPPDITGYCRYSWLAFRTWWPDLIAEDTTYLRHRTWRTKLVLSWRLYPYWRDFIVQEGGGENYPSVVVGHKARHSSSTLTSQLTVLQCPASCLMTRTTMPPFGKFYMGFEGWKCIKP